VYPKFFFSYINFLIYSLFYFNSHFWFLEILFLILAVLIPIRLSYSYASNKPITVVKQPPKESPRNCEGQSSGTRDIVIPAFSVTPFQVVCNSDSRWGGGWTVFLRRQDGSETFYRNWNDYKNGFGSLQGEFFMGLDKLHALTADSNMELLVVLEDHEGNEKYERYDDFAIGDEASQYILFKLGSAQGDAGDSLSQHRGHKFTTFDRDNDQWAEGNCASDNLGAWWYHACQERYDGIFIASYITHCL